MLSLTPCTITFAKGYVEKYHRHNKPPQGALFAVGASENGEIVGVAIIGRPIARMLDNKKTCEVTRLCTTGGKNVCSLLYGTSARAAKALGWSKIITYILETEPGTSLLASGWTREKEVAAEASWSRPSRHREDQDSLGNEKRPTCVKVRYCRILRVDLMKDPMFQ